MKSAICSTIRLRLARSGAVPIRHYSRTAICSYPTAIHRAERAADLKKHPESAVSQEPVGDRKHNHHWTEANATISEADINADKAAKLGEGEKKGAKSSGS